jgi:hypothetical protein
MSKTVNLKQQTPKPVAPTPVNLPPVQQGSKPAIGPGLPARINSQLGTFKPTGALLINQPVPAPRGPFRSSVVE